MKPTTQLRRLLSEPGLVLAPGAYNALTARMVEQAGFPAIYLGGMEAAACSLGIGDHGLMTLAELLEHTRRVADVVNIPVIADADDAGGTALNVERTVRQFEKAGAAAIHIEDLVQAKHLGPGGALITKDTMVNKIKAAVEARQDPDFVIIGRTDVLFTGGAIEEAIERGVAYVEAGADMLFITRLPINETKRAAESVKVPLLYSVTDTPVQELERYPVKVIMYSYPLLLASLQLTAQMLIELKTTGVFSDLASRSWTRDELERRVGTPEATAKARRWGVI